MDFKCTKCGNDLDANELDDKKTMDGKLVCWDCFFGTLGEEVEKYPLGNCFAGSSDKKIRSPQTIINFLAGSGEDAYGRTIYETLAWSDKQLEQCHSQVQWIFPLHEESRHADVYPIISPEIVEAAKKIPVIAENLRLAKERFENFYGLEPYDEEARQAKWCVDRNHNLLRITRIIRSLRLFGLDDEATDFYSKVRPVGDKFNISVMTLRYWLKAYRDDVWNTLLD